MFTNIHYSHAEAFLGLCQTSMLEIFVKIVNGLHPLTIFEKHLIIDVWQHPKDTSECYFMRNDSVSCGCQL